MNYRLKNFRLLRDRADLLIHRKLNVCETIRSFHPPESRQLSDFRNPMSDFRKSAYSTCVRSRQFLPKV